MTKFQKQLCYLSKIDKNKNKRKQIKKQNNKNNKKNFQNNIEKFFKNIQKKYPEIKKYSKIQKIKKTKLFCQKSTIFLNFFKCFSRIFL